MNNKVLKVYKNRKIFFAVSIVLIIACVAALFINGVNVDIQFKGGAVIKYTYEGDLDNAAKNDIANIVNQAISRLATVQTADEGTDHAKLILSLAGNDGLTSEEGAKILEAIVAAYPDNNFEESESNIVEPSIGERFLRNGIIAIVLAWILIVIYVWFRFKQISGLSAGVMAVIALIHDCIMVFATFVIFRISIGDIFVAVMLTIIGYSINNTIVIYDRIRENRSVAGKLTYDELVDLSITQSMSRSLSTTFTTVVSIVIIYVFAVMNGIQSIENFALPMTVGMLSGFWSSNFIACNLWVMWQKHKHPGK